MFAALFALCFTGTVAYADDPSFDVFRQFGTGHDDTRSIALGDVDSDGDIDIVAGNYDQQNAVYLNDGDGQFGVYVEFGAGNDTTRSVAVGDIDGDGDLDIITGNRNQQNVIHLNNGGGFFPISRSFGASNSFTFSIAVGDIDNDGDLDIVTANYGDQNIVHLNDGTGHFGDTEEFGAIMSFTDSLAIGDVDADGDLDIITGNDLPDGDQNIIYMNDGAGQFTSSLNFGTGEDSTRSVAVGDVDGDGDLDIVAGNYDQQNVVYLNNGGSFDSYISFGTGIDDTSSVALADMDSDGDLDIITGNDGQSVVYLNDGWGSYASWGNFGSVLDDTFSVMAADVDGDGHLDIVAGNNGQDKIHLNDGAGYIADGRTLGPESGSTTDVVLGDVDADGDLDVVAANSDGEQELVYLNDGAGGFDGGTSLGVSSVYTDSIAIGDMNGDGSLDVIIGSDGGQNAVYLNDGAAGFDNSLDFGSGVDATRAVAVGDIDSDGDLDIVAGNYAQHNKLYLNDGTGRFDNARDFGTSAETTTAVSLGDLDGDGDLDIAAGSEGMNAVFINDGMGNFASHDCGVDVGNTRSVAVGDLDGDGDLDIVAGNFAQQSRIYLNDGEGSFPDARNFGGTSESTSSLALGDIDGDGDLDIVTVNDGGENIVYLNNGDGVFPIGSAREFGSWTGSTISAALGDIDRDGDLDIVTANYAEQNVVYVSHLIGVYRLVNIPPSVALSRPGPTANGERFSTPAVISDRFVAIPYALSDSDGDSTGRIAAYYSLNGGGRWYAATAVSGTSTANLATVQYPTSTLTYTHVFTWDTFASGVFGRSDNAVFRLEAYPQRVHAGITGTYRYTSTVPGPYQRPYASATTFPFRVRGTQVRVLSGTMPVSNALVYRLPQGWSNGGFVITDGNGRVLHTDPLGYLRGHSAIAIGDTLVALLPITATESYTRYLTSATPITTGLDAFIVSQTGVQTLTVSADRPLILFNLDVSLEWDARASKQYMSQLEFDLQRASEILYDWSNGQAALGRVHVYHDREKWLEAHIRVYASNRLRPSATQGGIVSDVITDPITSTLTYAPGQVHIGAVWNRYGDPDGNLSEDWPRTLAHELGHYVLFLDDNYLGLDQDGLLITVDTCPGAMSDPYRDDDALGYDEFHQGEGWAEGCSDTLAARSTGRWDWQTISAIYPELDGSSSNIGPSGLPLAVTHIQVVEPVTPTTALEVPVFHLTQNGGRIQPSARARAFLFHGDWLTDLGRPTLDEVHARGARPGDRVCVFELSAGRLGCEVVTTGDEQMALEAVAEWQPEVIISPVTSRTIAISVTSVPTGLPLYARLFPVSDPGPPEILLEPVGAVYSGTLHLDYPALEGYVQIWVDEAEPRREIVTDYALGGNPGRLRGRWGRLRGRWGRLRSRWGRLRARWAPAVSADGQVIMFGPHLDFPEGEFYALQAATTVPSPLPWATVVGQAFRLTASANAPDLSTGSITFCYLGTEVPPGEEDWLRIYYWDGAKWKQLPTQLDTYYNIASAPTQGEGLYALMSSIEIPLYSDGWNLLPYPVPGTRPVEEALLSIDGYYNIVFNHVVTDTSDPWKVYAVGAPEWVNELKTLQFGQSYRIHVTEPITVQLKGRSSAGIDAVASLPFPPATFYGAVLADPSFSPAAGMAVTAWINDELCGKTHTKEIGGETVFAIDVLADDLSDTADGCGATGRKVTFRVNNKTMASSALWDNTSVREWPLHRIRIYLPLSFRGP